MRLRIFRSLFPDWSFFAKSGSRFEFFYRYSSASEIVWHPVDKRPGQLGVLNLFFNGERNLHSLQNTLIEEIFFSTQDSESETNADLQLLALLLEVPFQEDLQILIRLFHLEKLTNTRTFQQGQRNT